MSLIGQSLMRITTTGTTMLMCMHLAEDTA